MKYKSLFILVLVSTLFLALFSGCSLRNPAPERRDNQPETAPEQDQRQPETQENRAERIAENVLNVPGVESAYVLTVSNIAIIGLTLDNSSSNNNETAIIDEVSARIIRDEPVIADALVTTEPTTVAEIKKISTSIQEGEPVYTFWDEISAIINKIRTDGN